MAGEAEALAGMAWTCERTPCRSARWLVTRGEQGAHEHLPDGNVTHLPAVKVQRPSQAGLQTQLPAPAGIDMHAVLLWQTSDVCLASSLNASALSSGAGAESCKQFSGFPDGGSGHEWRGGQLCDSVHGGAGTA